MAKHLEDPHDRNDFFKTLGTLMAGFVAMRVEEAGHFFDKHLAGLAEAILEGVR